MSVENQIKELINNNKVVLFMKGSKTFPMCGFSGQVVHILNELECDYETVNILEDDELREGIKQFSNWPTLPQLYIDGEFVGGCDIITEIYESGELAKKLSAV